MTLLYLLFLHENKNDENMRGHVGSELLNKCSEVLADQESLTMFLRWSRLKNRNQASKLIYYSFRYDDDLPTLVDTIPSQNREEKLWRRRFGKFFISVCNLEFV